MKLVTKNHEEGSRTRSDHGCRFHQTLGLRTELFRHSHLSLLQSSPGLHASSAQPAGSDARDSGTQCCTQAALAAALAVAPCMLCSFTEPGRATFEQNGDCADVHSMSLTVAALYKLFPDPRLPFEIHSYATAHSRSSTKIAKSSGDNHRSCDALLQLQPPSCWSFQMRPTPGIGSSRIKPHPQLVSKSDAAFDGSTSIV